MQEEADSDLLSIYIVFYYLSHHVRCFTKLFFFKHSWEALSNHMWLEKPIRAG